MDRAHPDTAPLLRSKPRPPGEDLVEILSLMERLEMTPAGCLALLVDVLRSFDEAERDRTAAQHLDFPSWAYGLP